MWVFLTASLALCLSCDLAKFSAAWAGSATNAVNTQLDYRDFLVCGPNSLFMFLILCNKSGVTLEELKRLPISTNGVSLLVLRDEAKKFGVETEIRRYLPAQIDSVPLPAIGQFSTDPSSMTRQHFDVIYNVDPAYVYVVNGTTGFKEAINRLKLPIKWTGYAMVPRASMLTSRTAKRILASAASCLILLDVTLLIMYCITPNTRPDDKELIEREVIT